MSSVPLCFNNVIEEVTNDITSICLILRPPYWVNKAYQLPQAGVCQQNHVSGQF